MYYILSHLFFTLERGQKQTDNRKAPIQSMLADFFILEAVDFLDEFIVDTLFFPVKSISNSDPQYASKETYSNKPNSQCSWQVEVVVIA